jgi:amino acid permease
VTAVDTKAPTEVRKFSLTTLTAMVVGSMVGAGVFSPPRNRADPDLHRGGDLRAEGACVQRELLAASSDVGKATVIGFLGVLALFASVTMFSYGILPRAGLEKLRQPSMTGAMESVVGYWGTAFISVN